MSDKLVEQMSDIYKELYEFELEVAEHNQKFISDLGKNAVKHFPDLMCDCNISFHEKIKFVDNPKGYPQHEKFGPFKDIHVEQWCSNMEGDAYGGYIYAKIKGKWISIPYFC